jgi:hypothetical protein
VGFNYQDFADASAARINWRWVDVWRVVPQSIGHRDYRAASAHALVQFSPFAVNTTIFVLQIQTQLEVYGHFIYNVICVCKLINLKKQITQTLKQALPFSSILSVSPRAFPPTSATRCFCVGILWREMHMTVSP